MIWLLLFGFCRIASGDVSIWPEPAYISSGSEVIWLETHLHAEVHCGQQSSFQASTSQYAGTDRLQKPMGYESWLNIAANVSFSEASILQDEVHEAIHTIQHTSFRPWKFHKMNVDFDPVEGKNAQFLKVLTVQQAKCPAETAFDPRDYFDSDESYEVSLSKNELQIKSNSTLGTLRALETAKQLFYKTKSGRVYAGDAPIVIRDQPRFQFRGLHIDIARNPIAPEDVLRNIDAMATAKFSRLHIHATDSQSWPLEIPLLPELAEKGSYHPDFIWKIGDLKRVQMYGAKKGISVFIEIDVPGHTASIAHAYPDLITAFNMKDWSTFALEPLSGQLKLNSPEVSEFMDTLLEDLLPRVSPYTNLYHMGGDELNENAYLLDETVQSNEHKVLQPLIQKFMSRVVVQALLHELQPIVWEEMVLDWNLTLPKGKPNSKSPATLVQVWRNSERINEVLQRGHRVIFGDNKHWYLDCGFGVGFLDPYPSGASPPGVPYNTSGGFPSKLERPYLDYCNPYHNWREMLMYNPLKGVEKDLYHLVEGGEALMWAEQTDGIDLDFKLWPRAAAAAEVLWSSERDESMLENASRRLAQWRERVVLDTKVRASPVHMTWCLMEGGCNL